MEKRDRVKSVSSDPAMDDIFGGTQTTAPKVVAKKQSSDPALDDIFEKKNVGGTQSSNGSTQSSTSVSESQSPTPEAKPSTGNSQNVRPTPFNSLTLSSDQLQDLFDAPKHYNTNPNEPAPKKVSPDTFIARDIDTHAPNIFDKVAKATGQAMPFADKMSAFDKEQIAKETKLKVLNDPNAMADYNKKRIEDLRQGVVRLENEKLKYVDIDLDSGLKSITNEDGYSKTNLKIEQTKKYIDELKNNVAELTADKIISKTNLASFNPKTIGREIVRIADPELNGQFEQAEKGGSLPNGRRTDLERLGLNAVKNYLDKNPDAPEAKAAKAFVDDMEADFDNRNVDATAARVRTKMGEYFHKKDQTAHDYSGVFGYTQGDLREALNDPALKLTPSERKIAVDVVLPSEKRIWGTDIPGSGFMRSFRGAIEKSAEGTVKSVLDMTGARGESVIASDKLDEAENTRYAELKNRTWVEERLDGIGDLTGQVAMMALTTKGAGAIGKALTASGEAGGLLGGLTRATAGRIISNENVGLFVNSYLNSYDNYKQQAVELMPGKDQGNARDYYAKSMAFVEGLSEKVFNDVKVLKAFTGELSPTIRDITKRFISGEITQQVAKGELKSGISQAAKAFGKEYVKSTYQEGTEEALVDIADAAANSIFGGSEFNIAATGQKAFNTFLTTAMNSPLVAGMAAKGAVRENKQANAFYKSALAKMAVNPGEYLDHVDALEQNKEITATEANEKRKIIASASRVLKELPESRFIPNTDGDMRSSAKVAAKTSGTTVSDIVDNYAINQNKDGSEIRFTPAETSTYMVHRLNEHILNEKIENTTDPVVISDLKKQVKRSEDIRKGIYDGNIAIDEDLKEVAADPKEAEKLGIGVDTTLVDGSNEKEVPETDLGGEKIGVINKKIDELQANQISELVDSGSSIEEARNKVYNSPDTAEIKELRERRRMLQTNSMGAIEGFFDEAASKTKLSPKAIKELKNQMGFTGPEPDHLGFRRSLSEDRIKSATQAAIGHEISAGKIDIKSMTQAEKDAYVADMEQLVKGLYGEVLNKISDVVSPIVEPSAPVVNGLPESLSPAIELNPDSQATFVGPNEKSQPIPLKVDGVEEELFTPEQLAEMPPSTVEKIDNIKQRQVQDIANVKAGHFEGIGNVLSVSPADDNGNVSVGVSAQGGEGQANIAFGKYVQENVPGVKEVKDIKLNTKGGVKFTMVFNNGFEYKTPKAVSLVETGADGKVKLSSAIDISEVGKAAVRASYKNEMQSVQDTPLTNVAFATVNNDTKTFTTKSGNQNVVREDGRLAVYNASDGKPANKDLTKKALREYALNYDYTTGEKAPEPDPSSEYSSEDEILSDMVEKSTSPSELASIYVTQQSVLPTLSTVEGFIAEYGFDTTEKSFRKFGDKNSVTPAMALAYFTAKGDSLDVQAKEISDNYGVEVTPQDLVDFMIRFPNGVYEATSESQSSVAKEAATKFRKLTGIEINKEIAEHAVEQEFSKLDFINQALLNDTYDTQQELTDAYFQSLNNQDAATQPNTGEGKAPAVTGEVGQANNASEPISAAQPVAETSRTITEAGKELATRLRGLKSKANSANANIFGLAIGVYDGVIETVATAIENGAILADAIKAGIDSLSPADKRKLNEAEFVQHINDFAEGKKPKIKVNLTEEDYKKDKAGERKAADAKATLKDERRFTGNQLLPDREILPEVKAQLKNNLEYIVARNAITIEEADYIMDNHSLEDVYDMVVTGRDTRPAVRVALGQELIKAYNKMALKAVDPAERNKYIAKTVDIADFVSEKLGTESGQLIQAFSLYQRLSPEAQVMAVRREAKKDAVKQRAKAEPEANKVAAKIKNINAETAAEIIADPEVKKEVKKSTEKKEKRIKDKIEKARDDRDKLMKEHRKKNPPLYASVTLGLTPEGIVYTTKVAATFIREGVATAELLAERIKAHLLEATGKPTTPEVDADVLRLSQEAFAAAVAKDERKQETAINKGLKETDQKIGDIVKQHFTVVEETKRTLTQKLVDDAGLTEPEASELSAKLQAAFDRIATNKKKKLLEVERKRFERITNRMAGAKKVQSKEVQDEIIRYSNLGAFSDVDFLDKIANLMGTGNITPEQADQIQALAEKVQTAPEGSPKKEATEDLLTYRAKLRGDKPGEILQAIWYANVLSGYGTQVKNVVSTFFNGFTFFAVEAAKDPRSIPILMMGGAKGVWRGFFEASHTLSTGRSPIHISKVETPSVLERVEFKGGLFNPYNWLKYVGRMMVAEDVIQFQGLKEMKATQLAYKEAKRLGYKNPFSKEVWKIVNEKLLNTKDRMDAATDQAKDEGLAGRSAKRRVYELMELSRPEAMVEASYGFAAHGTFNHATEGTLGALTDTISHVLDIPIGGARPFRLVVPFTRIITNVVNNNLDFTPVGLLRAIRGERGFKGFMESRYVKDKYHKMTDEERIESAVKFGLGISVTAALYAMTKYKDDDDKPLLEITGAGPTDFRKLAQLKLQGWTPYSIKFNGTYYSYSLTPLIFNLGAIGTVNDHEAYESGGNEISSMERLQMGLTQTVKMLGDMTWIGSTATILGAITNPNPEQAGKEIKNSLSNAAKGIILPNFYTQMAQRYEAVNNLPQKDVKEVWQNMVQDIPIARNFLNDKINALGDPIVRDIDYIYSNETTDSVWSYLADKKGWVAPINQKTLKFITKDGVEMPADDSQYYEFSKRRGEVIKKEILDVMQNGALVEGENGFEQRPAKDLTTPQLQKILRGISSSATKEVKSDMQMEIEE